jgi:bacteriorhodopsin
VENNILIEKDIENFHRLKSKDLDLLLDRMVDSQFVLLGEASLGTSEFYRWAYWNYQAPCKGYRILYLIILYEMKKDNQSTKKKIRVLFYLVSILFKS